MEGEHFRLYLRFLPAWTVAFYEKKSQIRTFKRNVLNLWDIHRKVDLKFKVHNFVFDLLWVLFRIRVLLFIASSNRVRVQSDKNQRD